ncbi:MAG TPA: hypothetical protein VES73_03230 [Lamprocystis sp. (in: g-proteobacteria)]|nr:hypothetical protein [Lamprocystis sp. (in: g-proteobacteria)]
MPRDRWEWMRQPAPPSPATGAALNDELNFLASVQMSMMEGLGAFQELDRPELIATEVREERFLPCSYQGAMPMSKPSAFD